MVQVEQDQLNAIVSARQQAGLKRWRRALRYKQVAKAFDGLTVGGLALHDGDIELTLDATGTITAQGPWMRQKKFDALVLDLLGRNPEFLARALVLRRVYLEAENTS
jgi:hypothetical protein